MARPNYSQLIDENDSTNWNVLDQHKGKSLTELQRVCQNDALPFAVCAVSVTGDLNVGMMMRSASLLGTEKFIIAGRRKYDKRSTVGAQNYIDLRRISMLEDDGVTIDGNSVIDMVELAGYSPVAVEGPNPYIEPVDVRKVEWKRRTANKPCLIFGSEADGLPEEILTRCELAVMIPQRGVLRSFNVSAAAGIVMYEVATQLAEKDAFDYYNK